MQKVFISLLFICLFVVAPSLVQAAELELPTVPLDTTTEDSSASSIQQDSTILNHLSQLSSSLTTDVKGLLKSDSDSTVSSSQVTTESITSDTNAQVSEQPAVQSSETKIVADNQVTAKSSQSEVGGERTTSVENSNVAVSAELPALKQNTDTNPLLSVNVLGIRVDVLGETQQGSSLVDGSLLSINVNSIANVDLSSTQQFDTSGGLLGIDLGLPMIGNVNLDLLSGGIAESTTGETLLTQGGLLGLGITDSALLGNVNLGVLTGNLLDGNNLSGGLATIDLDNLLGKTHIGLIEGNKSTGNIISGGLLMINSQSKDVLKLGEDSRLVDSITLNNPTKPIYREGAQALPIPSIAGENYDVKQIVNDIQSEEQVNKDSVANFTELKDVKNKVVLNQLTKKDPDQLKQVIDRVYEKANHSESTLPSSGSSVSGSSGASSAGSSFSNGGSGVAAYLNSEYMTEMALNNQAQYIVNKLSNQWQLAPPVEPPKSFFFLNA